MDAVTIVIALLSASFMLCSAWSETSFTKLNNCLVDKEATFELIQNIAAAKECAKEYAAEPEVVELAQLIIDIDPSDLCGPVYIEKLTEAVEELEKVEPKWLEPKVQMMRLGSILHHCIRRAGRDCFERFEQQLLDAKDFEKNLLPDAANWKYDEENVYDKMDWKMEPSKETGLLWQAMVRYHRSGGIQADLDKRTTSDEKLKFAELDSAGLAQNVRIEDIDMKKFTMENTNLAVRDEYFLEDCEKFVELHESKTILRPVGQLAYLVGKNHLNTVKPKQGETILTFLWASRYFSCMRALELEQPMTELLFLTFKKEFDELERVKREREAARAAAAESSDGA